MANRSLSKLKFPLPKEKWLLLAIFFLGVFLRIFNWQSNPAALNRDEASIGYTAFSLLKTGQDEHGLIWPINYQSFGDWKLLVYPLVTVPFVALFGLSELSVRLPSMLAGSLLPLLVFLLVKNLQTTRKQADWLLPTLAAFLVAISPWAVHLSRLAYEANLALFFFTLGILLLLLAFKKHQPLLLPAIFFLVLTMVTYHSYQVFTPLMILAVVWLYRRQWLIILKKQKLLLSLAVSILFLAAALIFFGNTKESNQVKFSGLSVFSEDLYKDQLFANRNYLSAWPTWVGRFYVNRPVLIFEKLASNTFRALNADFLFFNGGGHGSHDTRGIGKMFLFQWPLLLLSIWFLLGKNQNLTKQGRQLIVLWFLASLVAPVITLEPAHSTRFSPSIVPFSIVSALGLFYLLKLLTFSRKLKIIILSFLLLLVGLEFSRFFITYYLVAPKRDTDNWNWYAKPLVEKINQLQNQYQAVYLAGKTWSPYIYFLFYNQVEPKTLTSELVYDPVDWEGFQHVNQWRNVYFGEIPWSLGETQTNKNLFIIKQSELPIDHQNLLETNLVYTLSNPDSNIVWYFIED